MNAHKEFLEHVGERKVKCAEIRYEWGYGEDENAGFRLKQGYSLNEWRMFINVLDFEYDNGYGGQKLFGTIWYTDGTWSDRGEYDGSEWWQYQSTPKIPGYL